MNKRGVSEVISIVLIILLVLVAVGIIWGIVIPLIEKSSSEIKTTCMTIDLEIDRAVFNATKSLNVTIKRNAGEGAIYKIAFIANDKRYDKLVSDFKELSSQTFEIKNITAAKPAKLEISPILGEAGDEKVCPVADSITSEQIL